MSFGLHSSYFHEVLREWQENGTKIGPSNLMYPIFISSDPNAEEDIVSMPGVKRWGLNTIQNHLSPLVEIGLKSVLIFGVPSDNFKDDIGTSADCEHKSPVLPVVKLLRSNFPKLLVACDVCLCAYTASGHCGLFSTDGVLDVEASVERLAQISLAFARAGCQIIAPSDMMDGRIGAIKKILKENRLLGQVSVLSYAAKFSSCFYGPFRSAASSAPAFGDRKAYQLPSGSKGLAMRAVDRDVSEGADMLMVKPAVAYLDIIKTVKDRHPDYPLFAYHVSGEYAMLVQGAQNGLFDLDVAINETFSSLRRAGADVIITYFTPHILKKFKY